MNKTEKVLKEWDRVTKALNSIEEPMIKAIDTISESLNNVAHNFSEQIMKPLMEDTGCETVDELKELMNSYPFRLALKELYDPQGITDWFEDFKYE